MPIPLLTKIAAGVAIAALGTVGVLTVVVPPAPEQDVWQDTPRDGAILTSGPLEVILHSDLPNLLGMRATITDVDTNQSYQLVDLELEKVGRGANAVALYLFDQNWDAVPGAYLVDIDTRSTSSNWSPLRTTAFIVLGAADSVPPTDEPTAVPTTTPTPVPSGTPTATPTPTPTVDAPAPGSTTPPPLPAPPAPTFPVTAGSATRTQLSTDWNNRFDISGVGLNGANAASAIVGIETQIIAGEPHGPVFTQCGLAPQSGSGAAAIYSCVIPCTRLSAGPSSGEFFLVNPLTVTFTPRVTLNGTTTYGTGGQWTTTLRDGRPPSC